MLMANVSVAINTIILAPKILVLRLYFARVLFGERPENARVALVDPHGYSS